MRIDRVTEKVRRKVDQPKTKVKTILNALFDTIQAGVTNGEQVVFRTFGTFEPVVQKGKPTNLPVCVVKSIPDRTVPRFRFSKEFRKKIKTNTTRK